MSYSYGEEDESESELEALAETAMKVQRAIAGIPENAEQVSKFTRHEANRIAKEIDKVRLPTASKRMRRIHVPRVMPRDMPSQPKLPQNVPRVRSDFELFMGRRRKIKDGMSILTGR